MEITPPDLMHLDYNILLEGLGYVVVYAIIIERALAPIFESRRFIDSVYEAPDAAGNRPQKSKLKGIKEIISIVVCVGFALWIEFDFIAIMNQYTKVTVAGMVISGMLIAGGSKGSIKLFRDILDFKSTAERNRKK